MITAFPFLFYQSWRSITLGICLTVFCAKSFTLLYHFYIDKGIKFGQMAACFIFKAWFYVWWWFIPNYRPKVCRTIIYIQTSQSTFTIRVIESESCTKGILNTSLIAFIKSIAHISSSIIRTIAQSLAQISIFWGRYIPSTIACATLLIEMSFTSWNYLWSFAVFYFMSTYGGIFTLPFKKVILWRYKNRTRLISFTNFKTISQ